LRGPDIGALDRVSACAAMLLKILIWQFNVKNMNLKSKKTMVLSYCGIILFLGIMCGGDCSTYIRGLRGNAAVAYGITLVAGAAASFFTFLAACVTLSGVTKKKSIPTGVLLCILIIYFFVLKCISVTYCGK
jgi:hypothetical protein